MKPLLINRHSLRWTAGPKGSYLHAPPADRVVLTRTFGGGLDEFDPDFFPDIVVADMTRPERLERVARWLIESRRATHIVALHEKDLLLAAQLREALALPGMTVRETIPFRDKVAMKQRLADAGYNHLPRFVLPHHGLSAADVPWTGASVLKSRWGLGSSEVRVLPHLGTLARALAELGGDPSRLELEEFVRGTMYHCEAVVHRGNVLFATVSEYLQQPGNFASTQWGGSVVLTDGPIRDLLLKHNEMVIGHLGLSAGVTHAEFFITEDGDPVFCEIAARPGGGGATTIVEMAYGLNLIKCAVMLQLGLVPPLEVVTPPKSGVYGTVGIFQHVAPRSLETTFRDIVPQLVAYDFMPPEVPGRARHGSDYGHKMLLWAPSRAEFDHQVELLLKALECDIAAHEEGR